MHALQSLPRSFAVSALGLFLKTETQLCAHDRMERIVITAALKTRQLLK